MLPGLCYSIVSKRIERIFAKADVSVDVDEVFIPVCERLGGLAGALRASPEEIWEAARSEDDPRWGLGGLDKGPSDSSPSWRELSEP